MKPRMVVSCFVGLLLLLTIVPAVSHAAVPQQINYQGMLTDSTGNPVPDGDYGMIFIIYDAPTGGAELWSVSQTVTVTKGIYNVILDLGYDLPPPPEFFDRDLYLGVTVGTDAEMTPRQKFTSTPFAFKAQKADIVADGAITSAMIANDAVDTDKVANNAITSAKIVDGTVSAADISGGPGSGLDADTLDGLQASSFLSTVSDYGRLDVSSTLYEGSQSLTSKYVNEIGDDMTGRLTVTRPNSGPTGWQEAIKGSLLGSATLGAGVYGYSEGDSAHGVHGGAIGASGTGVYGEATGSGSRGVYGNSVGASGTGVYGEATDSNGYGVQGLASATGEAMGTGGYFSANGRLGIGVFGIVGGQNAMGVVGSSYGSNADGVRGLAAGEYGRAVYGEATNEGVYGNYGGYFIARGEYGEGVYGEATNTVSTNHGGFFLAAGATGRGVYGGASGASGRGVYGKGTSTGVDDTNYGGYFVAYGGKGRGVYGEAPDTGYAGYFNGRVLVKVLEITGGSDIAEPFAIQKPDHIKAGTVMVIDPDNPGKLKISSRSYDHRVAGIVSGAGGVNPGMMMTQKGSAVDGTTPIALTGRVYCLADASTNPIEPGDLLTTSDTPGYAMKVTDHTKAQGATLGKAMTSLNKDKGLILVLVALQ